MSDCRLTTNYCRRGTAARDLCGQSRPKPFRNMDMFLLRQQSVVRLGPAGLSITDRKKYDVYMRDIICSRQGDRNAIGRLASQGERVCQNFLAGIRGQSVQETANRLADFLRINFPENPEIWAKKITGLIMYLRHDQIDVHTVVFETGKILFCENAQVEKFVCRVSFELAGEKKVRIIVNAMTEYCQGVNPNQGIEKGIQVLNDMLLENPPGEIAEVLAEFIARNIECDDFRALLSCGIDLIGQLNLDAAKKAEVLANFFNYVGAIKLFSQITEGDLEIIGSHLLCLAKEEVAPFSASFRQEMQVLLAGGN